MNEPSSYMSNNTTLYFYGTLSFLNYTCLFYLIVFKTILAGQCDPLFSDEEMKVRDKVTQPNTQLGSVTVLI